MNIIKEILGLFRRNTIVTPEDSDVLIVGKRKPGNSKTPQVNDALVTFKSIKDSIGVDATNTGTGEEVLKIPVVNNSLKFRTLRAGSNITLTQNADDIQIDAAGGGGAIGIADATGTYTYYNTIADANAAAVSGDTIEFFANINETTATEMYLVNGVTYQLNGHSYTLSVTDAVTNTVSTSGLLAGDSATILNGTIVRRGNTSPSSTAGLALLADTGATLYLDAITFTCEDSTTVYVANGSSIFGGTFINTAASYDFNKNALRIVNGNVNGCNFYSIDSTAVRKSGGIVDNCNIYSKSNQAFYDQSSSSSVTANCNIRSDGSYAYYSGSSNSRIYNCYCYSTASAAMYIYGIAYNCTGFSTSGNGAQMPIANSTAKNCSFISDTNAGVYAQGALSTLYNCTAYARVSNAYYGKGNAFNSSFRNEFNFSGGHCVNVIVDATYNSHFFNCTFRPYNSGAYCMTATGAININYGANVFENATTPINTGLITQAQTNTPDTFGNIQVG